MRYKKLLQFLEQPAKLGSGKSRLCGWHASQVQCVNKGKCRQPYVFVSKAGIAATLQGNFVVGGRATSKAVISSPNNLNSTDTLEQDIGTQITDANVDLGYCDVDCANPNMKMIHRGWIRSINGK